MPAARFHLGWFLNFVPDAWNETWGAGGEPWDGRFYLEMAQALERACFDYVIIEDKLMVSDAYGGPAWPRTSSTASLRSTTPRRWRR